MTKLLYLAAILLMGCAHVNIVQIENDTNGVRRVTNLRATTFFDAKSELAKARTTMTEKTQGITVSGLNQESNSTGAVQVVRIVVEAAGPAKAAMGIP